MKEKIITLKKRCFQSFFPSMSICTRIVKIFHIEQYTCTCIFETWRMNDGALKNARYQRILDFTRRIFSLVEICGRRTFRPLKQVILYWSSHYHNFIIIIIIIILTHFFQHNNSIYSFQVLQLMCYKYSGFIFQIFTNTPVWKINIKSLKYDATLPWLMSEIKSLQWLRVQNMFFFRWNCEECQSLLYMMVR